MAYDLGHTYMNWRGLLEDSGAAEYRDVGALQAAENASLIILSSGVTFTSATNTLSFTGLAVISPMSGARISVNNGTLVVPAGYAVVLGNPGYPLADATSTLQAVDLQKFEDRDARHIWLGVHHQLGGMYFRPDLSL